MATGDLFAVLRQFQKGPFTNQPGDAGYENHWNTVRPPDEPVVAVYPGVARGSTGLVRAKQTVNVVQTNQHYYIDTPSVERVGPVARAAGQILDRGGLPSPLQIPLDIVQVTNPRPERLQIQAPGFPTVVARENGFVGQPAQLSGGDQVRNVWAMLRG